MNGLNELITISKYWRRWSDPRLTVLVLNNRDLNQVTWEQRALQGDPKYPAMQEIPDFPYARYAELIGLHGTRVDDPERVGEAWDATSLVVVEVEAAGVVGLGWTYAPSAAARLIDDLLAPAVLRGDVLDVGAAYLGMQVALRNAGYPGLGAMAVSAVDVALWDL